MDTTTTSPRVARAVPSYSGLALDPLRKAPPWIHTITGSRLRHRRRASTR